LRTLRIEVVALREQELLIDRGLVGGDWIEADDRDTFEVVNPATGEVLAQAPRMGVAETRRAIAAAADAFPAWRSLLARERSRILRRWGDLLVEHADDLALLLTSEQGKPLAVAKLGQEAGLPDGVLSLVTGDADDAPTIGGELTSNPTVRKVGFTGSTEVGKLLMAQCSKQLKKISLELGGNAPFIVFDDADLDAAVAGTVLCKYRNSGQTCISANRILVQDGIYDAYLDALVKTVTKLKVGAGTEPDVNVGPLIDDTGFAKVRRHVEGAVEGGASLVLGGSAHALGRTFFEPTVLVDVTPEMAMSCEETFGPVAGIARFASEEEAVRAANATPYGLAAYFYSRDVGRVWRVSEGLDYGIVGINTGFISTEVAPFGGVKESGIGREGSKYGIEDWVELKYLAMAGLDA
jgi:succinate-semialdehyde dehydrogenase/glutarate-semialdehyde dehydrogenase